MVSTCVSLTRYTITFFWIFVAIVIFERRPY